MRRGCHSSQQAHVPSATRPGAPWPQHRSIRHPGRASGRPLDQTARVVSQPSSSTMLACALTSTSLASIHPLMKTASTSAPRTAHSIRQNHQLLVRLDSLSDGSSSAACSCSSRPSSCAAASKGVSSVSASRAGRVGDRDGDFVVGDFVGVWAPLAGAAAEDILSRRGPGKMGRPRLLGIMC